MKLPPKMVLLALAVGLILLVLAALFLLLRKRWRQGKRDFDDLRQQSRAMQLDNQGMADSAGEVQSRRRRS